MSVTVDLWSGPLDGQRVVLDAKPWAPPLVLRFPAPLPAAFTPPALATEPARVHLYERRPSPSEDGPVWRYVYLRDAT